MSKSNSQTTNKNAKSEIIKLSEQYSETKADIDAEEAHSPSISSFDENFNSNEMFTVTIDDHPHVDVTTNSTFVNLDENNPERNQFTANVPARSISRIIDEKIRQQIRALMA
ncbi:hypothetical protein LOAG_14358 [Loa loa]|uniref:Uncharacterized protein n=2 Tax=Loa loa TaxID=7209 RepID=A0A1S0TI03_LOALO|nr:hypothetical protein LOAG_14358 [Loa loa]EFO14166.1 hypothetical protein LOAG_14358 [Loa loa]